MASPLTSKIKLLDARGCSIVNPVEWAPAFLEIDAPLVDWPAIQLSIQGENASVRVERVFDKDRLLATWPRSGTGNYRIVLNIRDYAETLPITIRPRKISEASYAAMIVDLQERLPTSIAIGLQKTGGLSGIQLLPPEEGTLARELVRLRRAIDGVETVRPGLAGVLRELAQNHYSTFRANEIWVDRQAVRRPSATGLVRALVRGRNTDDWGQLLQVIDRRTDHSVDVYENRLLKMFLWQVRTRLHSVLTLARQRSDEALMQEIRSLRERLDRAERLARFLDGVSLPASLPMRVSMVLMRRDPYPAVLEAFLEFNKGLAVGLDDDALDTPLENLPSLYQTWGTLTVLDAVLEYASKAGFVLCFQQLCERRRGEPFIRLLPDGKPAAEFVRADGVRLRFIPEPSIAHSGPYRSLSFTQSPDIIIEIERGGDRRLLVFDPKYKLESDFGNDTDIDARPKKEDIDKMHAYRDAICDAFSERIVGFAAILYPGPSAGYGDNIAALNAIPANAVQLRSRIIEVIENLVGNIGEGGGDQGSRPATHDQIASSDA
ncbi:MAG: restriction endonuclease-like protein [Actinobacteria bacterium]|nr:restriction endonuclease-like protein [Actinomycetota bacterium]